MAQKPRFTVTETEIPESHILDKFTIEAPTPKEATKPAADTDASPAPAVKTPTKDKRKTVDERATPKKPEPKAAKVQSSATIPTFKATPTEETVVVNFKAGVPVSLATRFNELKVKSDMAESYLMDWAFVRALKIMETLDTATLSLPVEGPKTVEPTRAKRLFIHRDALARFRAAHDPLEVFKTVDCCRLIYVAAFGEALDELAVKLGL